MATSCALIVKIGPDLYHGVTVHWDGYLEGVGKTLFQHYNAQDLAEGLVSLGDLSGVAGTKWSGVISASVEPQREAILEKLARHTFHAPDSDLVIAYHRDRGDPAHIVPVRPGPLSLLTRVFNSLPTYIWDGEEWMIEGCSLETALADAYLL